MVNIGKQIRAARQKAGMSQEELAQVIGTTKSAVSRYEKGTRQPRYDQLQRIASALGVSVHNLVDWEAVDKEEFKKLFIYGEGPAGDSSETHTHTHVRPAQSGVVVHGGEMETQGIRGDRLNNDTGLTAEDLGLAPDEDGGIVGPAEDMPGVHAHIWPAQSEAVVHEEPIPSPDPERADLELLAREVVNAHAAFSIMLPGRINDEGARKLFDYAKDLSKIPEYRAETPLQPIPGMDTVAIAPSSTPPEGQATPAPEPPPETAENDK